MSGVACRRGRSLDEPRAPPGFWIGDSAVLAGARRTVSLTAAVEHGGLRIVDRAALEAAAGNR